jgi:D-glycero-alpha-D-manno-heptose 1-phosphate guanylyltransferase
MEAIVLAGGFGTRLRSVVSDVPKPMAPIAGRPFLEILLENLASKGIHRTVVSLGYLSNVISDHFGAEFCGMEVDYVVESSPLGTGGAIRLAMDACTQDAVFVFNGDTFLDVDLAEVQSTWQTTGLPVVVAKYVPDTARYGGVEMTDGLLSRFIEKGRTGPGLINVGCYLLGRHQLDRFSVGDPFSIEVDFLTPEAAKSKVAVAVTDALFIDIGLPEEYALAQTLLGDRRR